MRAHLARHARRALIQQSRSPSCALYSAPTRRRPLYVPISHRVCQRTFFDGLFQKAPREVRQPEFEPGWMKIMVWRSRMLDNLRPPPRSELGKAWTAFFKSKNQTKVPLNATQVLQCHRLLDYMLQPNDPSTRDAERSFWYEDVHLAFNVLIHVRIRERTAHHVNFVKALYAALSSGELAEKPNGMKAPGNYSWCKKRLIMALSLYGASKEALQLLYKEWETVVSWEHANHLVTTVARGLAREGLEEELVELVEYTERNGVPLGESLHTVVTTFFAEQNRVPETKEWFARDPSSGLRTAEVFTVVAEFAARNDLQDWAIPYFLQLGESKPEKHYWDSLLRAILVMGRALKQVEKVKAHMSDSKGPINADIATINGLLRAAVGLKDQVLAEDILSLATDEGLRANGETYLILMKLRLGAGYLAGVQAAYKKVKNLEPWQANPDLWWEFGQLLNEYLLALSAQKTPDLKLIVELIQAAEEDQLNLEPKTVAALCVRLLENEQHFDVMDILSVHAFQFSAEERETIQHAFTKFCLDMNTSTNRAWTCYQLLRQFFQDLSFEHRVQLMESFFQRKRPDMASHVFGHMRQHRNRDYHPRLDTYVAFFEGLGRHPDDEALEMVYNMLKMDTAVQPNTRLKTSLILAHTSCDKPLQALDFWAEITSSREGPTYASLEAVFWALERKPGGSQMARQVWKRIESMDVEIPPSVYSAYVGAVAGSGEEKAARSLILRMGPVVGAEPDAMTLGVAYNALPGQQLQQDFQNWAKMRYPEAWAELEKKGRRMTRDELCKFKLNRTFKSA
ncbi:Fc.00g099760.m01.CDS01 [Cosmosporella sp. VM-42]